MITLEDVTKKYHMLTALDRVSLTIPGGEVLGLLGPNGAGKTTLMRLVAGLITPTSGRLFPQAKGWPVVGYKPERLLYPNNVRVGQYLALVAGTSNVPRYQIDHVVLDSLARVNLLDSINKHIGHISKGMRQRLGLAQAIIGDPPLLLLDEPSNGLDPEGQVEIGRYIRELHETGKTIVLSSHQLQEVTQVCTQLIILNRGQIHYRNSMSEALALRPFVRIRAHKDLADLNGLLTSLHPDIQVEGDTITLKNNAMRLRRQILTLVLNRNYDVLRVEQKRVTLSEIYAETVQ
ncbi:MAG: ATP-binding cassette domain-containing protein [Chloroflexi bacterium]|jgi:ABC-2 type transport system ATP-binding protein|nr:ATP-binding cassette domain-containing protein [Chloroflexota bacterium]